MTREEAIDVLKKEADFLYGDDSPYNRKAFDMAIEALSDDSAKKDIIISMIRYSSQYNSPCPEWVYNVIRYS